MKNRGFINIIIIIISCFSIASAFSSCQSCSKSGRAKMIAMARAESMKEKSIPKPNTIIKDIVPEVIEIQDIVTPAEKEKINNDLIKDKIPPIEGELIQVEGLVLKEVTELTIKLNTNGSQIDQILAMRNYVFESWHYVFDPVRGGDTWRSAEATISLKYNGIYSGDCDDYAILMASFARQIGLRSRMVGGYDNKEGHAFAEFLIPENELRNPKLIGNDFREDDLGFWISLDWFKGNDHSRFKNDIQIFEDI